MKKPLSLLILLFAAARVLCASSLNFGPPFISTGQFNHPYGVAVDEKNGRLLVADTGNNSWKWLDVSALATSTATYEEGVVSVAKNPAVLSDPQAIAVDQRGNVYVVNTLRGNVKLFEWSAGGYTLNPNFCQSSSHTVDNKDILFPRDIAVGPAGEVYLLDSGNNRILKASGPGAVAWTVFKEDPSWGNPYGLAVDGSGTLFLADTGNHRILKIMAGSTTVIGHWGTGRGEFRFPRDVAVDKQGRIFVADTYNHRLQVLAADGHPMVDLGAAPLIGTLDKVVVDAEDRVFAVDSDNNQVLAFLGAGVPAAFDPFVRDYIGDPGDEPSNPPYLVSSPDILVRHHPDINLASAAVAGLESYGFEQPYEGQINYIYVAVHNRGRQPALDNFVSVAWTDPGSRKHYPADWKNQGLYSSFTDARHNTPEDTLAVPLIAPNGVMVVGPLLWLPPDPDSVLARDGNILLGVRVTNPYDYPPVGDSLTMARDSNNVSERPMTVARAPFPTGDQNTLVVQANYPDLASVTVATASAGRLKQMADWIRETSWSEASVNILERGPLPLKQPSTYYMSAANNLLVELAEDVLNQITALDPTVLDGTGPGKEIGRVVIVTNDPTSDRDWATTGPWSYTVQGKTRYLTVSVHGMNSSWEEFSHGMSHQLGMKDLYPYEHVTFPRPYVDGWDNMAKPMNGAHPLVWSKELSHWVTSHKSKIIFIPRPAAGTTWNNQGVPIPLHYQETASTDQVVGVAFGLTNGVTLLSDETAFTYVEARKNSGAGAGSDRVLPQTGVLMYDVNTQIPQGQGPVIIRDQVPGGALNNAAIPMNGSGSALGPGITVNVKPGTNGANYNLVVSYHPPATDYDVFMHPGDPASLSPDIWVDDSKNGYDEDKGLPAQDRGEEARAGEPNRVYARVFNAGPADAYDIEVVFSFSQPEQTVGQFGFTEFASVFIGKLEAGKDIAVYMIWTPAPDINPHTCAFVELRRLFNDTNSSNNHAQRNMSIANSTHASPYTPVDRLFQVTNDTDTARLFYFRADGIPATWSWKLTPSKTYVLPGLTSTATLHLQPPPSAPDCTSHQINVTGWTPQGDTLVQLGGLTVRVDLQKKTSVDLNSGLALCPTGPAEDSPILPLGSLPPGSMTHGGQPIDIKCFRLVLYGCTHPAEPNQDITLRYVGPDGNTVYHTVHTDAKGCFEDFNVVTNGGEWQVEVDVPSSSCLAPAMATGTVVVPYLPPVDPPDDGGPNGERRLFILGLSQDADGEIVSLQKENVTSSECGASSIEETVKLQLNGRGKFEQDEKYLSGGELEISNLRHILSADKGAPGLHRGRFVWRSGNSEIVGAVKGVTNIGTHHQPLNGNEMGAVPDHWEMSLNGTVIKGGLAGSLVRAELALDVTRGSPKPPIKVVGALEGVVEVDVDQSVKLQQVLVKKASETYQSPLMGPCRQMPCLFRIAKTGGGEATLTQTGQDHYSKWPWQDYKTWSRLEARLTGVSAVEGRKAFLKDGVLTVKEFLQVMRKNQDGRGEHTAAFIFEAKDGTVVSGHMLGLTQSGTHRSPGHQNFESYSPPGHLEGRLWGLVRRGKNKGAEVEAHYVIQFGKAKGRRTKIVMTVDGWAVKGCLETPRTVRPFVPIRPVPVPVQNPGPLKRHLPLQPAPALPDNIYRKLDKLPSDAVKKFQQAEGGKLSPDATRTLRIADFRFRGLDKNKNGALDFEEFSALNQRRPDNNVVLPQLKQVRRESSSRPALPWEKVSSLDANRDGKLTGPELDGVPALLAREEFNRIDLNHDGKIDFSEFSLYWRQLPSVKMK